MKKRWAIAGAAVVAALLVAAGIGYYLHVRNESRDIRGSSTVEFVPTTPVPTVPKPVAVPRPKPGKPPIGFTLTRVDWPTFGYDGLRLHYLPSPLAPPFDVQWTFRAHHLVEFPPAVAYGRVYFADNPGTVFAISALTGRIGWRFESGRCTAASPAVADGDRLRGVPEPRRRATGAPGRTG